MRCSDGRMIIRPVVHLDSEQEPIEYVSKVFGFNDLILREPDEKFKKNAFRILHGHDERQK